MATQLTNYQCPACTGPLHFNGASGKLVCDFCGSSYDTAEIEALYAQKEATAATSCPYCGNPTVIAGSTPPRTTAVPAGRVPTATVLAAARAENSDRGTAKGCRNAAAFLVVITPQTAWQRA